jgi:hypothetical protein
MQKRKSPGNLWFPGQMGAEGTESTHVSPEKHLIHMPGGAESGADKLDAFAELAELVALWPHLPEPVRVALIRIARST